MRLLRSAASDLPEACDDHEALSLTSSKRRDRMRSYFDGLAGRFGREYLPGDPGRGWLRRCWP